MPLGIQLNDLWVTSWAGGYSGGGVYQPGQLVRDGAWLMVANKTTADRPAPQPQGAAVYAYQGASPTTSVSAKQLIQGAIYTPPSGGFLSGYRVYTVTGNFYRVYTQDANGQVREILNFEADATGWAEFSLGLTPILPGVSFSLLVATSEPDPTPTVFSGDWDYLTPQNEAIPLPGEINHSGRLSSSFRLHKTDDNGGDRSAELAGLSVGDIIEGAGVRWAIQVITDNGAWIDFTVAPAQQGSPAGVQSFSFETVTATPITYLKDVDYWLLDTSVQGLEGIDTPLEDITPDANQYGVDLLVQGAYVSPDWELLTYTGSAAAGGGSAGEDKTFYNAGDISGTWVPDLANGFNQEANATAAVQIDPPAGAGYNGATGNFVATVGGSAFSFGAGWIWGDGSAPDPTGAARLLISYLVDSAGNVIGTHQNLAS